MFKYIYLLPTIFSASLAFLCAYSLSLLLHFDSTIPVLSFLLNTGYSDSLYSIILIAVNTLFSSVFNSVYLSNIC
jgi:hypothetical protein